MHRHPRNDVRENLVMLCGDGVRGCHGLVEARDEETCRELGIRIREERPDVIAYLVEHLGDSQARAWLQRHLWLSL